MQHASTAAIASNAAGQQESLEKETLTHMTTRQHTTGQGNTLCNINLWSLETEKRDPKREDHLPLEPPLQYGLPLQPPPLELKKGSGTEW
jgi:hypothetical protein